VLVNPTQLVKIQNATAVVQAVAALKPDDPDVAIASARLTAAVPPPASPPASSPLALSVFLLALGSMLAGCGASNPLPEVAHVVQVEGRIVVAAEPCLVSAYKAEQQACLDDHEGDVPAAKACVDRTRAAWKDVIAALVDEHDTRCKLEPAKCPAKGK
jgi:hypothetical protein